MKASPLGARRKERMARNEGESFFCPYYADALSCCEEKDDFFLSSLFPGYARSCFSLLFLSSFVVDRSFLNSFWFFVLVNFACKFFHSQSFSFHLQVWVFPWLRKDVISAGVISIKGSSLRGCMYTGRNRPGGCTPEGRAFVFGFFFFAFLLSRQSTPQSPLYPSVALLFCLFAFFWNRSEDFIYLAGGKGGIWRRERGESFVQGGRERGIVSLREWMHPSVCLESSFLSFQCNSLSLHLDSCYCIFSFALLLLRVLFLLFFSLPSSFMSWPCLLLGCWVSSTFLFLQGIILSRLL